jgi:competence protein ComEC
VTIAGARQPHLLLAALCAGIAGANGLRVSVVAAAGTAAAAAAIATAAGGRPGLIALVAAICAGWWWGSARLAVVDHGVLESQIGRAERTVAVVTGPPRRTRFHIRVPVAVRKFGRLGLHEPALLELPLGRSPPQGALLEAICEVKRPRGRSHGFDERIWLRRHGVHVVLRGDRAHVVGRRGGFAGLGDRFRARFSKAIVGRLHGERRSMVLGVVLGEDQGLSNGLRQRFRASGLYHLLAVSGQNVALVAGATLLLAWLLGVPRQLGELSALGSIGAYVIAVGAQPSVVRAGVAGALTSLAWLTARARDRWYFLLLGALVLLAWNPYVLFDAGFQLSFAAVAAIFTLVPRLLAVLEGYPLPKPVAEVAAVSTACSLATAPIMWLQFHMISLVAVPANMAAAPAIVPLLGLALSAAILYPLVPSAANAAASLNGVCAGYLAGCARFFGGLPLAQIRSGWGLLAIAALGGTAAYAWQRWRRS